jgi:group II intron reverse transcriptase/maturase
MITSVTTQIGDSQSWKELPWKKFQRHLFGLQNRLFKAAEIGNTKKIKSIQKLIARSNSIRYISIRQVTQLNSGKKTAGIDGKISLSEKEKMLLAKELQKGWSNWKPNALKSVQIPTKNGKTRIVKISTIRDRAWQCLAKNVIEPAHEAFFHERSYGFRPGRSCHDAQKFLHQNLNSNIYDREKEAIEVIELELDIKNCFDRINHNSLMTKIIAPGTIKLGLFRSLKIGLHPEFPDQSLQNILQESKEGMIGPLLANIMLNGIEKIHKSVRYADDMIFIIKKEENKEEILNKISEFLIENGLKINLDKTKITSTKTGFNFLGWHFQCKTNGKLNIRPSKDNFEKFRTKVKNVLSNSSMKVEDKVLMLSPIIQGWRNYHKYSNIFSQHTLWALERKAVKVFNTKKNSLEKAFQSMKKAFPKRNLLTVSC